MTDDVEFILTYVPNAELYSFDEALLLAEYNDLMAAFQLTQDIMENMWGSYLSERFLQIAKGKWHDEN